MGRGCRFICALAFSWCALARAEEPLPQQPTPPAEPSQAERRPEEPARISEIRFVGNETTRPAILLQEMSVRAGDPANPGEIERSRQAIMDLGLFERVDTALLPDPAGVGQILEVRVEEKIYVLPIPRLNRNADGDISYGLQLRGDNLSGLNQSLHITYEKTEPASGEVNDAHSLRLEYSYPRLAGTPYGLDVNISRTEETRDLPDQPGQIYGVDSRQVGFTITRLLERFGPTRGWRVYSGMVFGATDYEFASDATPLYEDNNRFALTGGARFADVRDYLYSRAGEAYGYSAEIGIPTDYQQHEIYFRQYRLVTEKPHYNLNYQVRLGVAEADAPAFSLGGSGNLRGYPRGSLDGNAYLVANVEYLQPLFGYKTLRGLVFLDIGNAYPRASEMDLFDLKTSVGLGLRYVLKSFVNVQLRLDYAYAVQAAESKAYAGTKDSF